MAGALLILGMESLCRLGIKCERCGMTSTSKETSIKNGYYLGEYEAITKKVKLKHHDLEIELSDAWFEKEWFINSTICLIRFEEVREGEYNVIFPFKKSKEDVFLFSMAPIINGTECESCGGIREDRKEINISELPDTIVIQIQEKNPESGIGWKEGGLPGEKIKYVKK